MYRTINIMIRQGHEMYSYFDSICHLSNNLYNATLFRIRQVMTGIQKDGADRTENEKEVFDEISNALPKMGSKYKAPTKEHYALSYFFLESLLKTTENPDYNAPGFPKHCAQLIIRKAVADMTGFYHSSKDYARNPSKYLGRPKLPNYKKSGGKTIAIFSNQSCILKEEGSKVQFPNTKLRLAVGEIVEKGWKLKQVTARPYHDVFVIGLNFETEEPSRSTADISRRVCAIDVGVSNFAAITNNAGLPCLLFKGGVIKSANQWYNKKIATIMSEQTKGTTQKFVPTPEYYKATVKRENRINDYIHKAAKRIVQWCIDNDIDTIVIGVNKLWKQEPHLDHKRKQMFVQLPFFKLRNILKYLSERNGIRYIEHEESYTSQASFLFQDEIPIYKKGENTTYQFSGRRAPTRYNGHYRKNGFRGIYKNKDGTFVNSDLNGSANIGRKVFPELFKSDTIAFDKVKIIKDLDHFLRSPVGIAAV